MAKRPEVEALDAHGLPYLREAHVIGELPLEERLPALPSALEAVSRALGLPAVKALRFGLPVFEAFGLTRRQARCHARADLLLLRGEELSLSFVPAYAGS